MTSRAGTRTGHTDTRLLAVVLDEVSALKAQVAAQGAQVAAHDKALRPAFAPGRRTMTTSGPGDYPREPYRVHQTGASREAIWGSDMEHSQGYTEGLGMVRGADGLYRSAAAMAMAGLAVPEGTARGATNAELRKRSADDALMRAALAAEHGSAVIWESQVFCAQCRPAAPCRDCAGRRQVVADRAMRLAPVQTEVAHHRWSDYPEHAPVSGPEPPDFHRRPAERHRAAPPAPAGH